MLTGSRLVSTVTLGFLASVSSRPVDAAEASPRVWVVDDGSRIDPRTGKAFEESELYPEALRLRPGYREANCIFDAGKKEVRLAGARNEALAFQVQVESEIPLHEVNISVSSLEGPAPFPAKENVRLFKEWYVEVKRPSHGGSPAGFDCLGPGWYPDALIPLDERVKPGFGMPFDVPDEANGVPDQKVQAVWVDLSIPREQRSGAYSGTIRVTARQGAMPVDETLALRLEVFSFALPDENHLGISLNDYGSISPGVMPREKLWAFYRLCHAHRCVLDVLYDAPRASGTGDALELDWSEYDAAFGPLLDGSAFTARHGYRGPGEGVPVPRFYLPFESSGGHAWPRPPSEMKTEPYERAVQKALREFERHFLEKGWTRTKLMMFYNRYDESDRVEEISYFARLLREAGLREPGRFLYRVDGGSPKVVRGVGLENVGIWCVNGNVRYTHIEEQREIVRRGDQVWIYSSDSAREPCIAAPYIDTEALALRTWGWIPWKYRDSVTTLCEWGTFYHGEGKRWRDPSLSAALGGKEILNGDALLIYPGEFVGLDGPVPCIRLKALRRGSQDHEYLRLTAEKTGDARAADAIAGSVLFRAMHEALKPGQDVWQPHQRDSRSHDPNTWDEARRKLADLIEGKGGGAAAADAPPAGRGPRSDWPAWRKAMTEPDTIYDIGDNSIADIRYEWPGGEIPRGFATTDDGGRGTGATTVGYSGGVLLRGAGRWGVMTYGSGGHDTIANQIGCLDLNGDRAHYGVWQQPIYRLAPAPGAECWWSPKDAAALPESRRFAYGGFDPKRWDGGFPLAIDGWMYRGPMKYDELADKVPTGQYRYAQHCYIPAEYTGLGTGVWFIPNSYKSAPGFRDDPVPAICDPGDLWPSGRKKWYAHYQREDTRAWGRVPGPVPEAVNGWLNPGAVPGCAEFCAKHRMVVVPCGRDCDAAIFDVSQGIEKGTWSWRTCAKAGAWPDPVSGKCAVSNGHPRGRALLVWHGIKGDKPSLNIMDLDDPKLTTHVVTLPALKHLTVGESPTLHYIPAVNRFLAFGLHGANYGTAKEKILYCQKITVPDDLADAKGYAVEDVPLKLAPGVDFGRTIHMYGKCQYHEALDCLIFMVVDRPAKAFWIRRPGTEPPGPAGGAAAPASRGATLEGDRWTPARDAPGEIAQSEWDGLPLGRWIEWMGTSMESQIAPPYGAPEGYRPPGNNSTGAHYNAYTGAGWDEKDGRFYHFGGGHADGGNNMLTCFDVAKGRHTVVIPPTHQARMPEGYKVPPGNQNLSHAAYPSGKTHEHFPSSETPAGDDKPCASHEWSGIVFVPGIDEVLLPRFGWFHAMLGPKKWRVGPQTEKADRLGFKDRGGIFFHCHHLPRTGLVYMTGISEGEHGSYFMMVEYDPVKRKEVGAIDFDANCGGSSFVDGNGWFWMLNPDGAGEGQKVTASTVDLPGGVSIRKRTACGGRRPYFEDGDNPAQYVPDLDKVLVWCTRGRAGEAKAGEMLEFDRAALAFKPFPVDGTPPPVPTNMNNKVRYWPRQKVLVFQLATDVNARVIKLAR